MQKRSLLILLYLSFFYGVPGQTSYQKFYHLTRNNGLSQSTVNCIIKDAEGYMWFGTRDGLNRYDGYEFRYYKYREGEPNSIGLGRVNVLFCDNKGRLWVGTDQGGLNLFNPEKDNFTRFTNVSEAGTPDLHDVRDILQPADNYLYIATHGNGLLLFDTDKLEFRSLTPDTFPDINSLELSGEGTLYLGTEIGIYSVQVDEIISGELFGPDPLDIFFGMQILDLYIDRNDQLWAGTYGNGAFLYDPGTGKRTEFSTLRPYPYRLNHDIIRAFISDSAGNMIIGTGGGGMQIFYQNEKRMAGFVHELNNQYSLNSNIIYSLYRDIAGNLWIGTYNGGVNIIFRFKDKFGHIRSFGGDNDLSNNAVLSIIENSDGKLWIGTDGGGLDLYDPVNKSFLNYSHDPLNHNSLSGNVITSLLIDSRGWLWAGTFNAGLNRYDPETGKFTRFEHKPDDPNGVAGYHIWEIGEDANGHIWVATLGGGLNKYDPEKDLFTTYNHQPADPESLSEDVLTCLLFDHKGDLWVGTDLGGICRLTDPEKGVFKTYNKTMDTSLISSNQITTFFEDSKKNLWVGTAGGGLNLYLPESDRFVCFTQADGLVNNLVYAILEDEKGNLWISTNNGLSCFIDAVNDPSGKEFVNYNIGDGLQSSEFSAKSACRTVDGVLYFGGINGINYFRPEDIVSNQHIPPIVFTDLKIFNESVDITDPDSPLESVISETEKLVLKPGQSVFSLEFAALDFTMPDQNHYKFILEGFEDKWNDVGVQRTATYTNLNPGTYRFRVQGSNNDGVWNTGGASLDIVVLAPFWKTWWFRGVLILSGLLLMAGAFWWRNRTTELQRIKLKKQVSERTGELQQLNEVLEDQNKEINAQREELLVQKNQLEKSNQELARNQKRIEDQNIELENHRSNLQELVRQRTAELEAARLRAEESDQLKSAFLANMSHEIRTPLNAIVGFSNLLVETDTGSEARDEYLTQINRNTDTLLVLIRDILDLSRIESNQLRMMIEEIDLNSFIEEFEQIQHIRAATGPEFRIRHELWEKRLSFHTDSVRLRQILNNLLDNAFKFTEKGHIELGVKQSDDKLCFWVEDTGIGMSTEVVGKIFDRFYKNESLTAKIYRGAGLGLTITLKLTELLGGKITVDSVEGKGSRFELILPLKKS